ncbi:MULTISPECIES: restriction endonuclease subunit S [unclassified Marinobacterium]|uniref:restriction endonuclease subunit S n=1 Tax=unclassified Marinobacterium TaxID=2644139 RepID=UPI0015692DA8|nr:MULTISPECIES: restriction endonuclease subunit S [unclassified Marinobacterium]NRP10097.1 EcoKI restriction-modification system protein HsdS [Marinobacterium sp. xm-g-48]NRP82942.1 EcoKI restriction-modification system protein HsdS [Marinobacterium sp. xm-d-509]
MSYQTAQIGSLAKVISGYAFPSAAFTLEGVVPVIKIKNIKIGTADISDAATVAATYLDSLDPKFRVQSGDILISLTGSHITQPNSVVGRVGRYPRSLPTALLNQRAGKVIPNPEIVDTDYLYYVMLSDAVRREIAQFAHGAASQANVSPSQVESVVIPLPPFETQRLIGQTLVSYDLLIENNTRRIAILEEMAQVIYREWFVEFNAPGLDRSGYSFEMLPDGWQMRTLKEVCRLTMGQSPKSEFYNEVGDGLPFYQGVKDYGKRFPVARVWCNKPTRISEKGDILFSVRAPVGRLNISTEKVSIGRGLASIKHNEGFQSFLFQQLKHIFQKEDIIGNGAIFNAVTKSDMENIKLLHPSTKYLKQFSEIIDPIFDQLVVLESINLNLVSQRDLLLPKLISGQIELS